MSVAGLRWRPFVTRRRDRGAVAILVALLLGSGVLFGMAALAIDVGNLYAERAQLLNGADAAALNVARVCASPAGCDDSPGRADDYASENANDGAAEAAVCGRGGDFLECSPSAGGLTDCVGARPEEPISYVEVQTSTLRSDGTPLLPPIFAQAVLGGGFEGANVKACARTAWGPPSTANGFAMTISACDWNNYTNDGRGFPPAERSFPVFDEATSTTCAVRTGPGGGAGGFRWLTDAGAGCRLTAEVGDSYRVNTGDSRPNQCRQAELTQLQGRPVLVPVFSSFSGGGGNADYTVSGFAAFVVTGWHLPGAADRPSCPNAANSCVYGYFTRAVVTSSGVVAGPDLDLGARIVARVG